MSFEALKAQQGEAWGTAPWEPMLEFEEGELRLTAGAGGELRRRFTSYDGAAKAQVDSLDRRRAEEYRRAYIPHHERHRTNGRISLRRRYLVTLGRRRRTRSLIS